MRLPRTMVPGSSGNSAGRSGEPKDGFSDLPGTHITRSTFLPDSMYQRFPLAKPSLPTAQAATTFGLWRRSLFVQEEVQSSVETGEIITPE